jgi:hypothetical protein
MKRFLLVSLFMLFALAGLGFTAAPTVGCEHCCNTVCDGLDGKELQICLRECEQSIRDGNPPPPCQ